MAQTKCQHTADVLGGQSQTLREMETELMFLYIILGAMIVLRLSTCSGRGVLSLPRIANCCA